MFHQQGSSFVEVLITLFLFSFILSYLVLDSITRQKIAYASRSHFQSLQCSGNVHEQA